VLRPFPAYHAAIDHNKQIKPHAFPARMKDMRLIFLGLNPRT